MRFFSVVTLKMAGYIGKIEPIIKQTFALGGCANIRKSFGNIRSKETSAKDATELQSLQQEVAVHKFQSGDRLDPVHSLNNRKLKSHVTCAIKQTTHPTGVNSKMNFATHARKRDI